MDATVCETLDYRNVSRNEWMSEIVDDIQEHGTPLDAIVFVDYIDGNDTESEYSRCLDYGIAIGYGDPKLGIVTNQISYVLRSEPLDGKSDNRLTELKCMSKRQNMVHAMSSGLKTIRNFYLANSSKMSDSEPEETFKISPSTIDPAAIKYVIR